MPALSPTMTEGNLAKWLKKEGDKVSAGDVIAEIETDKATMEVEAVDEGTLGKILIPEGTQGVAVNSVIAVLLEEGESASDVILSASEGSQKVPSPAVAAAPAPSPLREREAEAKPKQGEGPRIFASPLAKRIAKDKGVDLSAIKGSGPHGRIVKADVESPSPRSASPHLPLPKGEGAGASAQAGEGYQKDIYGQLYKDLLNNNIKKITAKRLTEAKQTIPHFYLTVECIIDNLLAARKDLNEQGKDAYKLSVNDFIIKASAMALKSYPAANVSWSDAAILQYKHADISIAVSTPNGLITPIIKRAEEKGLAEISNEMKELAARARAGKLKPEEFQGGTFSISNLGMYGVSEFQAIINPPQSCILAVGAGIEKPVVINGKIEIRTVMNVTLSTDHRSVDGAVGAEWLQHFKRYIENPVSMLV
jgi:pyruvate dehydrogenase E2 component (dihydrolipoamide acetyltransferase)